MVVSQVRCRERRRSKPDEPSPTVEWRGLVSEATQRIERVLSKGGQPRSASSTCSEASGKRGRWDQTNAIETVLAEEAGTVAQPTNPIAFAEESGRRGGRARTRSSSTTTLVAGGPTANADFRAPAVRDRGPQPSKRRSHSSSRPRRVATDKRHCKRGSKGNYSSGLDVNSKPTGARGNLQPPGKRLDNREPLRHHRRRRHLSCTNVQG